MPRTKKPLGGKVAVVAGATRGAGRGIAREYRFTDADGTRPDWGEHAKDIEWPDWLTEFVDPAMRRAEAMLERMKVYLPKKKVVKARKKASA